MSVYAADVGHLAYLALAVATHGAVGYALATALASRLATGDHLPTVGAVAGVFPDVDLLFPPTWSFPFVHRGITHTPICGVAVVAAAVLLARVRCGADRGRAVGAVVAVAYCSHLVLDSLTSSGIPWLYPVTPTNYGLDLAVHGPEGTLLLWAGVLGVLWRRARVSP